MTRPITDSTDLILEALALLGKRVWDLEDDIADARAEQKTLCVVLVLQRGLPQAEVARVAGLNRQTVYRWCREAPPE